MPKYTVLVTRDVTESVAIEVEAKSAVAAQTEALTRARHTPLPWEPDETPAKPDIYVTATDVV